MVRGPQKQKLQQWQEIMTRYHAGHHTIADFCEKEGVSQASFYNWKKKLAAGEPDLATPNTLPIRSKSMKNSSGKSKETQRSQKEMSTTESTVIRLPNGIELELGDDKEVVAAVFERMLG